MNKLAVWTDQRQANAAFLDAKLHGVVTTTVADGPVRVSHRDTVRSTERTD